MSTARVLGIWRELEAEMADVGKTFEGSCHCGRVRYQVTGPWGAMTHCHCTDCQKSHGAAFGTYVQVARERFRYSRGEEHLQVFEAPSGTQRVFCRICGSKITGGDASPSSPVWVLAATLDTHLELRAEGHIFVRSKAPWHDIHDDLPQHAAYPEEKP